MLFRSVMAGSSAYLAASEVREKTLAIAGHLMKSPPEALDIEGDEVFVRAAPKQRLSLKEAARAVAGIPGMALPGGMTPGLSASATFVRDEMAFANGAGAAIVEADPETGAVRIEKFVIAHDCGRVIHPALVEGQILGGLVHGIGNSLYEWMRFDDACQPLTATLADYLLVGACETPPMELLHMESPSPLNPLGVKGVGECGVLAAAPAIVSAIEDALSPFDVKIARAPIMPSDIAALIKAARKDGSHAAAL